MTFRSSTLHSYKNRQQCTIFTRNNVFLIDWSTRSLSAILMYSMVCLVRQVHCCSPTIACYGNESQEIRLQRRAIEFEDLNARVKKEERFAIHHQAVFSSYSAARKWNKTFINEQLWIAISKSTTTNFPTEKCFPQMSPSSFQGQLDESMTELQTPSSRFILWVFTSRPCVQQQAIQTTKSMPKNVLIPCSPLP